MDINNVQAGTSNSFPEVIANDTLINVNESVNTDEIARDQNGTETLLQLSETHETPSLVDNEVQLPQTSFVEAGSIDVDDQLPELMSVSDESDDSEDVHDVEMTLITDEENDTAIVPSLEPITAQSSHSPTRAGSRRMRIEDDDEDENNRRRSSPRLLPSYTPPSISSSPQTPSPSGISTRPPSDDVGSNLSSVAPERPTRPVPRNGPSPLRHQHIPFGTGLVPAAMPFDIRSMFGRVFGPTPNGEALPAQSINNENQATSQTISSTVMPASAPANIPAPVNRDHFQNQFSGRAPARAMLSFFSGPAPGVSTQQQPGPTPGTIDFTMGFFQTGPGATPHSEAADSQIPRGSQPNDRSQWRPPPEFLEALIRTVFRDGPGSGFDGPEREDPERAAKLVAGLEEVPVGLTKRMERLTSLATIHPDMSNGGDDNCAVCWEKLLSNDAIESPKSGISEGQTEEQSSSGLESTNGNINTNSSPNDVHPQKIVALPCAHVFHVSCLVPWFSRPRQATCPTCRFNIDPENLTYVFRPDFGINSNSTDTDTPPPNVNAPAASSSQSSPNQHTDTTLPESHLFSQSSHPSVESPSHFSRNTSPSPAEPAVEGPDTSGTPLNTTARTVPHGPIFPPFLHAHINSMPMFGSPNGIEPTITVNFDFVVADAPPAPRAEAQGAENVENTRNANQNGLPPILNQMYEAFQPIFAFGPAPRSWPPSTRSSQPKREWVLPSAPGLTLRQRVEKQEREAGLRCWDISCGVGPTDDDPNSLQLDARQISIHHRGDPKSKVCSHTFHPECLVTAERVAGWGIEERVEPEIEVACPVCRSVGVITNQEWEEGDHLTI